MTGKTHLLELSVHRSEGHKHTWVRVSWEGQNTQARFLVDRHTEEPEKILLLPRKTPHTQRTHVLRIPFNDLIEVIKELGEETL